MLRLSQISCLLSMVLFFRVIVRLMMAVDTIGAISVLVQSWFENRTAKHVLQYVFRVLIRLHSSGCSLIPRVVPNWPSRVAHHSY